MFRFYCFFSLNTIVVSNYPTNKIKGKYGHRFEILASIKSQEAIPISIEKLKRNYKQFTFTEWIFVRHVHTAEMKDKIRESKLGKERDHLTKSKISRKMRGVSNFAGHRHSSMTKLKIALARQGKPNVVAGTIWIHDGRGNEKRVKIDAIPPGWRKGRDFESYQNGIYALHNRKIH